LDKYSFDMKTNQYIGYMIDVKCGVHVNPSNIQVIHDSLALETLIEIHIFLGLTKSYHNFMLVFSNMTWTLIQLTKGGAKPICFFVLDTIERIQGLK
jgi:hypothetical protein